MSRPTTRSPSPSTGAPVQRIDAGAAAEQPWRNGGGRTRELLCWPSADAWSLRISLADIDADGPFSAFPGTERWFAVVGGAGVVLSFAGAAQAPAQRLRPGDAPFRFDGADAPHCCLVDGPTRDLNLIARGGAAAMRRVEPGVVWHEAFALRGLYAAVPGRWSCDREAIDVEAGTLLWDAAGVGAIVEVEADAHVDIDASIDTDVDADARTGNADARTEADHGSPDADADADADAGADADADTNVDADAPAPVRTSAVASIAPWRFDAAADPGRDPTPPVLGWWLGYTPDARRAPAARDDAPR